jgi:hypothetical protein
MEQVMAILVWDTDGLPEEVISGYPAPNTADIDYFIQNSFVAWGSPPPPVISVKIKYLIDNNLVDANYQDDNPFSCYEQPSDSTVEWGPCA